MRESVGRIHGVGIRDRINWCWYQKQEAMAQLMEVIERTGTGFTIYYYPAGNPQAKIEVQELAERQTRTNVVLMPRLPGDPANEAYGIERIEPTTSGIDALKSIVHDFFSHQIKRYILGQTLSSESDNTGLGSSVADLHQDTFAKIIQYDAIKLEETLTQELLSPLQGYNFPATRHIQLHLRLDTQQKDAQQKLQNLKAAFEVGVKLRAEDIYETLYFTPLQPGDEVLQNPAFVSQENDASVSEGAPSDRYQSPDRLRYWDESKVHRVPKGSPAGGEFAPQNSVGNSASSDIADPVERAKRLEETARINQQIGKLMRNLDNARRSLANSDLSDLQKKNLQSEIDGTVSQINDLKRQRSDQDDYADRAPYKHYAATKKPGLAVKQLWDEKEKMIDAVVEAIKGKIEGLTDPAQIRQLATQIALEGIKKLSPGIGKRQRGDQDEYVDRAPFKHYTKLEKLGS